jgi:methylmalonyl-CoA epimerase
MPQAIGKLDHIGIAVRSLAQARTFYQDVLGGRFLFEVENPEAGFKLCELEFDGTILELMEPLGENSFLHRFLETRGEGLHHLTFAVPDSKGKAAELKARGVRVVEEKEWSPTSYEAFISPRSTCGVLIQLGSGYPTLSRAPEWEQKKS